MSDLYEPHDGSHQNCAPCFAIKIRTVQFQGMEAGTRRNEDKSRARDMDEYKRLRRQGLQPKHVFGSAEIGMQANSQFEVEHSVVMAPSIRKEMESRMQEAKAITST